MNCDTCGAKLKEQRETYHFVECGLMNVYLEDWRMLVCSDCKIRMPYVPKARPFMRMMTEVLVNQRKRLNDDEILFLRKAMGLTAQGLADLIGVHRVEVSRWENERARIDAYHEFRLRMHAIDSVLEGEPRATARENVTQLFGLTDVSKLSSAAQPIRLRPEQLQGAAA